MSFSFAICFGPFTMLLVERSSETGLLDVYLTTFFRVCKLKNTSALRVIFFENIQNWIIISKFQKNIQKIFFVYEIIASENVALNCLY